VLLAVALAAGCAGGGDTVIGGLGNSGNHIGTAALWGSLAKALAAHEATPQVSDDEVRQIFAAIRGHAMEGQVEAALIVLKVAEEQRSAK
jgi:hypothetical protein